jgi:peptidoglycan/xylan/chitin deacetylase (PgdA/CDA1 family)
MSLLQVPAATGSERPPTLAATRRMAVLDELRVPYRLIDAPGSGGQWDSLSTGDPRRALYWYTGRAGVVAPGWQLGSLPIWGCVAPDAAAARFAASLPGEWAPEVPVVDLSGAARTWAWRSSDGATLFPFDPDELVTNLRSERYLSLQRSRGRSPTASARRVYYACRPLLPRSVQIELRRAFSRMQARTAFPRWPAEPALHDLVELVLGRVADVAGAPVPYIGSWPRGRSWALVLTHDVETAAGRDAIEAVRAVEQAAGYRSAWNLVPERYEVPDALVEHLKAVGCEVGVHGLRHDGRDLESLGTPNSRLPEMRRWALRWQAEGFRSPATLRHWDWMPKLGFGYDSSYPDTDPFEPMAGGCCSWLPFFNRETVELPITLPQDHTVFVILRRDESVWRQKAELLRARGGMALVIVHPDYMTRDGRLDAYRRFLEAFRDDATAWKALPREVAAWWRRRAATSLHHGDGQWYAAGPAEREAAVAFAEPIEPSARGPWA